MKEETPAGDNGEGFEIHQHDDDLSPTPSPAKSQRNRPASRWHLGRPRDHSCYGATHRRLRREVLQEQPNCSCGEPATEVDHVRPLCLGGDTERANLAPICRRCHRTKTGREGAMMRWRVNRRHMDRGHG